MSAYLIEALQQSLENEAFCLFHDLDGFVAVAPSAEFEIKRLKAQRLDNRQNVKREIKQGKLH